MFEFARLLRRCAAARACLRAGRAVALAAALGGAVPPALAQSGGLLQFSTNNYVAVESAGFVTVTVTRSGAITNVVTVDYTTADGTATNGVDYLEKMGTLVFGTNETVKTFSVLLLDNTVTNAARTVQLSLSAPTGGAALGVRSNATLTILDNDLASDVVGFELTNYTVLENAGSAFITLSRTGARDRQVTVDVRTAPGGTATPTNDYEVVSRQVIFPIGASLATFEVPLVDDTEQGEGSETVFLELSNPNPPTAALLGRTNAVLTILENDFSASSFAFAQANFTVPENSGAATVTVQRAGSQIGFATVDFFTRDGTATNGVHHTNVSGTLTFTNGQRFASFTVPLINDGVLDQLNPNRTVNLVLTNATGGASIGLTNAMLTIQDDDSLFRFSTDRYVTNENGLAVIVTVLREGGAIGPAAVTLFTSDAGAPAGSGSGFDFTGVFTNLAFADGQSFANVAIPINDDVAVESNETYLVVLTNAINGTLGTPDTAQFVILDNDSAAGTFAFAGLVTTAVSEFGLTLVGTVLRLGGNNGAVSVTVRQPFFVFDPCPGTTNARQFVDYNLGTTTLNWAGGDSNPKNFSISIVNDQDVELDEVLTVELFNPTGGAQISADNNTVQVLIEYDDLPPGAADRLFNPQNFLNPTPGANNLVYAVAAITNGPNTGKAIIGGDFTAYNTTPRNRLARVNVNGTLDASFDPGAGADGFVNALALQPDGKVVIGGGFSAVNFITRNGIARLNADGSVDGTFDPGAGVDGFVSAVAVQADGRILIGGQFDTVNGVARRNLARLNADGSVDTFFDLGPGVDGPVNSISLPLLPPTGCTPPNPARITFNALPQDFAETTNYTENCFNVRGIGGVHFHNGVNTGNGTTAAEIFGVDGSPQEINLNGATFTLVSINFVDVSSPLTVRASSGGTVTVSAPGVVNFGPGFSNVVFVRLEVPDFATVDDIVLIPPVVPPPPVQAIVIGGDFTTVGGIPRRRVARLNTDGTVDLTFDPGLSADGPVYTVAVQSDSKVLVGGAFGTFSGLPWAGVARVEVNGQVDVAGFNPGTGFDGAVYALALQSDGLPVLGGNFSAFNGVPRTNVARLNANGTLDTGFLDTYYNQRAGLDQFVSAVALTPATRVQVVTNFIGGTNVVTTNVFAADVVYVGGAFTQVGGGLTAFDVNEQFYFTRLIGGVIRPDFNLPGNVEFIAAQYTVDENDGEIMVTVRRSAGLLGNLTVSYATVDGSAVAGINYSNVSGQLFWDHCEFGDKTIRIPILDNATAEGDKSFKLVLSAPFSTGIYSIGHPALGFLTEASVVIVDNDFNRGELGFSQAAYYVSENVGSAVVTVTRTGGSDGSVSVRYATANGSAVAPADYTAQSGTLLFAPGETVKTFTVPVVNDVASEFEETINLRLSNPGGGAVLRAAESNATLVVMDNENGRGSLSFSTNNFVVAETNGVATITVRRTSGSLSNVTVQFTTLNGTNRGAFVGVDYLTNSGTLTFSNGQTLATFNVTIREDSLVEGDETVLLVLSNPTNGASLGFQSTATITIKDNDAYGRLGFTAPALFVNEPAGGVIVNVVRTDGQSEEVSVDFTALAATAGTNDFVATNGTLTFLDGETTMSFFVPIVDDFDLDPSESLTLLLTNFSKAAPGAHTNTTLVIVDDESLAATPGSVNTGFGPGFNDFVNAVVVQPDAKVVVGGAFTAVDGVPRNRLTRLHPNGALDRAFDPGAGLNGTVNALALQPDGKIVAAGSFTNHNGVERFHADGRRDSQFNPGTAADNPVFAVAVSPGDGKLVVGGAFARFNGVARPFVARLNTNGVLDASFNTGAGPNGTVYAVAVQPDGKVVIGGAFTTVNNTNRPHLARLNADGSLDLTFDPFDGPDDTVYALALQPDGKVLAGGSFTEVFGAGRNRLARFNTDGSLDTSFLASAADGANNTVFALALPGGGRVLVGGDFTLFNNVTRNRLTRLNDDASTDPAINFGAGANSFVAAVAVQQDGQIIIGGGFTEVDGLPRRYLAMLLGGTAPGAGTIEFAAADYAVDEFGGNALLTVVRRGGTAGDLSVRFATSDGTATNLDDYLGVIRSVSFLEGETLQIVPVPILDDDEFEPEETVLLTLSNPSLPGTLGSLSNATLTIRSEECLVGFTAASYSVSEDTPGGFAVITVERLGPTNSGFTVDFRTGVSGTARTNADFLPISGTFAFGPGEVFKTFNVTILNDPALEGNETVTLRLRNASPPAALARQDALLTIVDDDFGPGILGFASATNVVGETNGEAIITVTRTNGSRGIVSVQYAAIGGTATAGGDYDPVSGILTFGDGETVKTFRIPLHDDLVGEGDETVNLFLAAPAGGATLGLATATLLIVEDDPVYGTFTFTRTNEIVIPNDAAGAPYPSVITVSNRPGVVSNVVVRLRGFSHLIPADVDVLLVGPQGQKVVVMGDAGGSNAVNNVTLRLDDGAANPLPEFTSLFTGTFRPANYPPDDTFPAPAPAGPYGSELFDFIGTDPNGDWSLFVVDDGGVAGGAFSNGWQLILSTVDPAVASDVAVSAVAAPDPVEAGSNVTFTVTVTNAGLSAAAAVRLTDTISGQGVLLNATPSQGGCSIAGNVVVCDLLDLAPGAAVTVVIDALGTEVGTVTNRASVRAAVPETTSANNLAVTTAGVTANPAAADLAVIVLDDPDPVAARDTLTYTVIVTNRGPQPATGVFLTNALPEGVTFGSASASQGTFMNLGGGLLVFDLGALAADSAATATLVVTPRTDGTLTNVATAGAAEPDFSENRAVTLTTVLAAADLTVVVNDLIDPVGVGGTVTYTAIAFNNGPSTATGVTLIDTLPAQVSFTTATPSQGSFALFGNTIVASFGSIPNGGSASITIEATVNVPGIHTNYATVVGAVADPDPSNNSAFAETRFEFGLSTGIGIIDNGVVQLGVHAEGHLNVPGGEPSSGTRTRFVGLRYLPTGAESTAPGCLCEGWGVADSISRISGSANEAIGGVRGITVESFVADGVTAKSTVRVGVGGSNVFRVVHFYHPIAGISNLYQVDVSIQNISSNTVNALYRRVMDWDVEPTAFREYSTMRRGNSPLLVFTSDDGFASADPLSGPSSILATGNFTDSGPADHGALFDFDFGLLTPGEVREFRTYYGASGTEAEADLAVALVGAEAFSYGQPSTANGPTLGTPNTFIFAFGGIGGSALIGADVGVTMTVDPVPVILGEPLTYTITVTNRGPDTATGVVLTDTLPPNVSVVSVDTPSGTVSNAPGTVTVFIDSLARNDRLRITLVVIPTAEGAILNRATVTANQPDGNQANNTALGMTTVLAVGTYTSSQPINITDATPAVPYPSTNRVAGLTGVVSKVTVTLIDLTHSYPADLDILLVAPGGAASVLLMSDVGGGDDLNAVTLKFDDDATNSLSISGPIVPGIYKPTNVDVLGPDMFLPPAPVGGFGTALSAFNGLAPNGDWLLFIMDDQGADAGVLAGGWQLKIDTTNAPAPAPAPLLVIEPGPAGVELSWPAAAADYVVESCPALGSGAWERVPGQPATTLDGRCRLTVTTNGAGMFFRLRRP